MEYIFGGIACICIALVLLFLGPVGAIISLLLIVAGVILAFFKGYSRRIVDNLILRLTVSGDEFVCGMNTDNIEAILGMKSKIREKKR